MAAALPPILKQVKATATSRLAPKRYTLLSTAAIFQRHPDRQNLTYALTV